MSYDPDHRTIAIYQDKSTLLKSVLPSLGSFFHVLSLWSMIEG
jgi:hypothetical protein